SGSPRWRRSRSWRPKAAAIDNETLDHLLSVVEDNGVEYGDAVAPSQALPPNRHENSQKNGGKAVREPLGCRRARGKPRGSGTARRAGARRSGIRFGSSCRIKGGCRMTAWRMERAWRRSMETARR